MGLTLSHMHCKIAPLLWYWISPFFFYMLLLFPWFFFNPSNSFEFVWVICEWLEELMLVVNSAGFVQRLFGNFFLKANNYCFKSWIWEIMHALELLLTFFFSLLFPSCCMCVCVCVCICLCVCFCVNLCVCLCLWQTPHQCWKPPTH